MSPAEELRFAAQKLRDTAAKTSPGRWRIVKHNRRKLAVIANAEIHKGDRAYSISLKVPHNLADNEWAVLASPALAEPLAGWLDWAAIQVENHPLDPAYGGMPEFRWCLTCQDDEPSCVLATDRALAAARVINGGDS